MSTLTDHCVGVYCENDGTCLDEEDHYRCDCVPGFINNHCEEPDDCYPGVICENGGSCVDGNGNHSCTCVAGYLGERCQHGCNSFSFQTHCV